MRGTGVRFFFDLTMLLKFSPTDFTYLSPSDSVRIPSFLRTFSSPLCGYLPLDRLHPSSPKQSVSLRYQLSLGSSPSPGYLSLVFLPCLSVVIYSDANYERASFSNDIGFCAIPDCVILLSDSFGSRCLVGINDDFLAPITCLTDQSFMHPVV